MKREDFQSDLKNCFHNGLLEFGIRIPIKSRFDDCVLDYLTIFKKLVIPTPRKVEISRKLAERMDSHPKQKEINHIVRLLETGKNVNYFQNKRLFQTKFHDHLVYEWDIYHFHLSLEKEKKTEFAKQVNDLLFVYIDGNEAVLLDTDTHKTGMFGDLERWLGILIELKPEKLEKHVMKDVLGVSPEVSPAERQSLWDSGLSLGMTMINGKCFFSKGIGRSTSGHSSVVVKDTLAVVRWVFDVEKVFFERRERICQLIGIESERASFKALFDEEGIRIVEISTKQEVIKYPLGFCDEVFSDVKQDAGD